MAVADHGEQHQRYPNKHTILLDKAYSGIENEVCAIIPKKKPIGRLLFPCDIKRNIEVSYDRVQPKNFVGRNALLFGAFA